ADARGLQQAIAAHPDLLASDRRAQVVLRALAVDALASGHVPLAEGCLLREIASASEFLDATPAGAEAISPGAFAEQRRVIGRAALDLARCKRLGGSFDEARERLGSALSIAEAVADMGTVAETGVELATLDALVGAHGDAILAHLRGARAAAL